MKNINNKTKSMDPMAEARKNKNFLSYSKEAAVRINLGVEVYNLRVAQGISQQKLARITKTTQKMISNIENGDVDVRFSTLNKIKDALGFQSDNWSRIYGFLAPIKFYWVGDGVTKKNLNKNKLAAVSRDVLLN
jgi:transcriptional regulator with XRE-family HTH domain